MAKYAPEVEQRIADLLAEQKRLMRTHGPMSEPVRQHIRTNADVGDYKRVAFTYLCVVVPEPQMAAELVRFKTLRARIGRLVGRLRRRFGLG